MRNRSVAIGCALLCALVSGCGSCGSGEVVAKLQQSSGTVDSDDAAQGDAWERAENGHDFHIGDAVRTAAGATASVKLTRGGTIRMQQNSLIRFQRTRGGGQGVQLGLDFGEAVLESGNEAMDFETMFGAAHIDRGSTVWIGRAEGENTRFEVQVGSASVEAASGTQNLAAGDSFLVDVGGAIVETRRDAGPPPPAEDAGPPPPVDVDAGEVVVDAGPQGAYRFIVAGRGARIRVNAAAEWQPLPIGEGAADAGAQVAVPTGGTLNITGPEGTALVRGSAQVTLGVNGSLLESDHGNVTFTTGASDVRVQVPGGSIVARAAGGPTSGTIDVRSDAGSRVRVQRGEATVRGPNGTATLRAGQSIVVRDAREAQPEVPPPPPPPVPARDDLAGLNPGPTSVKFGFSAGESVNIHDPTAPTAVRVRIGDTCPGDAVLELGRNGSFNRPVTSLAVNGSATVLVPNGSHRYRVRCANNRVLDAEPRAQGSVRVARDAGTQQLPRTAPRSTVGTDGRRYTVLYQTILPEITFDWPHPAEASGYDLTITPSSGRPTTVHSARPTTTIPSGRLDEGTYTVVWAASDGSHQSRPTTMRIDFDNATPVAFLRSPAANSAMSGTVHIDGGVQEGATVSVGGQNIPVDAQNRFVGDVPAPAAGECLAIRLAHPQRGIHYYLRCPPGASP